MSAAGRVCTGFSKPYVAKYTNNGGTVAYSDAMQLARGVSVNLSLETEDNNTFYADNVAAEEPPAKFIRGTATLTVDGLLRAAEKFILGLPDATTVQVDGKPVAVSHFGDDMNIPYMGIGFVARYQSAGVVSYEPVVLTKTRFKVFDFDAATQEDIIDWQTQELSAKLMRDDTSKHDWKLVGEEQATEAAAEAVLLALLGGAA